MWTDFRWQSCPDSDLETNFELNDTLYARASISPADAEEVYLWLGANVMLAYPLAEAESMLAEKLSAAEISLGHCEEDLEFLREQITVCPMAFNRFVCRVTNFFPLDARGCHSARLQLGRCATAQR
jgi:hypothetical protein